MFKTFNNFLLAEFGSRDLSLVEVVQLEQTLNQVKTFEAHIVRLYVGLSDEEVMDLKYVQVHIRFVILTLLLKVFDFVFAFKTVDLLLLEFLNVGAGVIYQRLDLSL